MAVAPARPLTPSVAPGEPTRALLGKARDLLSDVSGALAVPAARRSEAERAYKTARDAVVSQQLAAIPVGRLREITEGRLRLGPIEDSGFTNVAAVLAARSRLGHLPGVGPETVTRVMAAARQLESSIREKVRVRFDVDRRPPTETGLLAALHRYETAETAVASLRPELEELRAGLERTIGSAEPALNRLKLFFGGGQRRREARAALAQVESLMSDFWARGLHVGFGDILGSLSRADPDEGELWRAYESRAAAYNGLLIDVAGLDAADEQGLVPAEIAERVRSQTLDTSLLKVRLRGYQSFGARFALVQRRTMIGDEMGLGKTIEALAAICHLRVGGETHFLVVCPASVLANWGREIRQHTKLATYRLHGPDRTRNTSAWARRGGVAVTTYDSLQTLPPQDVPIAMVVVDEAHYIKNPSTRRACCVSSWIARADRVLFLTGTPMENRLEEFRVLATHLQPGLFERDRAIEMVASNADFRSSVAPVYLRRNQMDVLDELPPRIDTQDWVDMDGSDLDAYVAAVRSGNFMAMRRAAFTPGSVAGSAKLARLVEIADESLSNGRKVVVFSFFRTVLDIVEQALGPRAIGVITGSVPPARRQELIDRFTAGEPRVLLSQIEAGGVGLNIQTASVVILTEPQWKPTTEDQAIARCHRMGQVRPVEVHRLLSVDSVDERMLAILAVKSALFDAYARPSDLKDVSPDAVDVSDVEAARTVATQAEAERRIIQMERRRFGLEPDHDPRLAVAP